jgi:hypothetical protein
MKALSAALNFHTWMNGVSYEGSKLAQVIKHIAF